MFNSRRFVFPTIVLVAAFSATANGQQPMAAEQRLPFDVKANAQGLEVLSYHGADGLLQAGDIISWIATPDSDQTGIQVTSLKDLEIQAFEKQDQQGRIALWVTRGNQDPNWIIVPLIAKAAASRESALMVTVRAITDGVEVVTYTGTDGLLRPGDVITWVSNTVGDASGVLVDSAESFQTAVEAQQDKNGAVALWAHHVGQDPDWVIVTLGIQPGHAQHTEVSIRVKATGESLEVESYSGTDGLLQQGDLITWVSTPGSDDAGAKVTDPATFQTELRARQDSEGHIALYVQRPGGEPNWIIVPLRSGRRDPTEMANDQKPGGSSDEGMERQPDDSLIGKSAGDLRTVTIPLSPNLELRWCPPGTFMMGSPPREVGRKENEDDTVGEGGRPVEVILTRGFWISQAEITQQQWAAVMGPTPWVDQGDTDYYKAGLAFPAVYISWDDAEAYCARLTEIERLAGQLPRGWRYSLPTEAQWEYACRAGTTTAYSFGDDESQLGEYAWFYDNTWEIGEQYAHAVREKEPNPWGLYDMHGNVWEWCRDGYADRLIGGSDPLQTISVNNRVLRGGFWVNGASFTRAASRDSGRPDYRAYVTGFRVVCVEDPFQNRDIENSHGTQQLDVPFTVISRAEGLEVTEYRGTDGLLRPGDYLSRVASIPSAGHSFSLNGLTSEQFEQQCRDCANSSQVPNQITVFREDGVNGHWVSMKLFPPYSPKVNLSTKIDFTVKAASGGVEVLRTGDSPKDPIDEYDLKVGDVITHVGPLSMDLDKILADDWSDWKPVATREAFEETTVKIPKVTYADVEGVFAVNAVRPTALDRPVTPGIATESPLGVSTLNDSRKLHVLLVYDSDPSEEKHILTFSTNWNAYRIREFLERSIPEELRSEIQSMTTDSWSRKALLEKIHSMAKGVGPKDTFAVFFCGVHGSNEEGVGHVFHLPHPTDSPGEESEQVARAEIYALINNSPARLKMLVTESCSHGLEDLDHGYAPKPSVMEDHRNAYWNANAARYLFFRHKGFLDVNSSSPGQYSWVAVSRKMKAALSEAFYEPEFKAKTLFQQYKWAGENHEVAPLPFEDGGQFTSSLLKIISKDDGKLSELGLLDAKGRLTWEKVLPEVQTETSNLSLLKRDVDQTPFTIETPEITGDALPKQRTNKPQLNALDTDVSQSINRSILGMDLYQGDNCVVVGMPYLGMDEFLDGSPAWYPLRQGDEITHVELSDSYFWRALDPYELLADRSSHSFSIKTLNDLHKLLLHHNGDGTPPELCKGMWKFTVRRDGKNKEIDVRVTSPCHVESAQP